MVRAIFLEQSKGHNSETKKGEKTILCIKHRLDLILIHVKLQEDIPNG